MSTACFPLIPSLKRRLKDVLLFAFAASFLHIAHADETEIFRADNENSNARPKVLIIFDNSGSMDTLAQRKPTYNPAVTYPTVSGIQSGRLYWASGNSGGPPPVDTNQWFNASINRCASSFDSLNRTGAYGGSRFGMYSNNQWSTLNTTNSTVVHVDCGDDISDSIDNNGPNQSAGYPRTNATNSNGYGSNRDRSIDDNWSTRRLYSANYMNWWYSPDLQDRSRMEVAQGVITEIVESNPGIDFGLATFNYNNSSSTNGGRIISRIIENMSATQRTNVVNMVGQLSPGGNTPLCESMYEAYRYLSGGDLYFATQKDPYNRDGPARDTAAERSTGRYISPVGDCQYVYVILMTDGEPTQDTSANSLIETLTNKTCAIYGTAKNCMPELAEYMYNADLDGVASNGIQRAVTYTIGFTTAQKLLSDTAAKGGGQYYTADSTEELTSAFQGAITSILSTNASFTSPAVAVDSFTRTESRDDVFYAMFKPTTGTNWPGNIKKLKIRVGTDGVARLVDSNAVEAIDSRTGFIKDTAQTYWGTSADGPSVEAGGVGGLLASRDPDTRVIWTNTGTNGALQAFNTTNLSASAYGLSSAADLYARFDVNSSTEFSNLIAWARGWTDSTKTARRQWILGDIVYSRPLVLNYGARTTNHSASNPDLRVIVGTNAGFLHMFDAANGAEDWAFFPKELTSIFKQRKDDQLGGNKVWGLDSPVVVYRLDANGDGSIKATDGDKMYIFFGLRRGGRAYYGMDVTDPNSPRFLWRIGSDSTAMAELGQSWSVPVVTTIPGYTSGGVRQPVLIFGGGYDPVNDDITLSAAESTDTMGRGVMIVDATTGALVWSVTPAATSAVNKQETGFVHAMAAPPSVFDSDGDGISDRIYIPDVGGNVWRIDMPGSTRPTTVALQAKWRVTKLASLADTSGTTRAAIMAGDRRFMSETDVVRTVANGKAFDAVLLGSGDRTNPKATDNNDRLFMLRDYQTTPYTTDPPTATQCTATVNPSTDNRCKLPITESSLYNATANLIQVGNTTEVASAKASLRNAMGWYIDLNGVAGQKSLAPATTLRGISFFTTFSPNSVATNTNICEPAAGTGRLFALDLQDASAAIDFDSNGSLLTADRFALLGSMVPDAPSLYFSRDQQIRLLFPAGGGPTSGTSGVGGNRCGPGMLCGPRGLRSIVPKFRYEREY